MFITITVRGNQKMEYEVVSTVELGCYFGAITANHTKEVGLILRF